MAGEFTKKMMIGYGVIGGMLVTVYAFVEAVKFAKNHGVTFFQALPLWLVVVLLSLGVAWGIGNDVLNKQ